MPTINDFKNIHSGEKCVIIGNGPSLNKYNLGKIELPTFGTNRIYLRYIPDYYVAVNSLVVDQWWKDMMGLDTQRFIPVRYKNKYDIEACWIKSKGGRDKRFQKNLNKHMWEGHTVTYVCLQIAYWMGFQEVIMIGVDHDYGEVDGNPNEHKIKGKEITHFDPNYFPSGSRWALPNLEKSTIAYNYARKAFDADGRIIYVTMESKLKGFVRKLCLQYQQYYKNQ